MGRIILHIDLDAFFASVEQREKPELKDKPVVVGANPKAGRGVVSTASYPARRYGIRSGMPILQAYMKCPEAVFLPVNGRKYMEVSSKVMNIARNYCQKFQQNGVDEAFLDVTNVGTYAAAEELAYALKEEIFEKECLTCSIGMGQNKLIAKMASDFEKPDGLTIVRPGDSLSFLWQLPIGKLYGVGGKSEARLKAMGIYTIGGLAKIDESMLIRVFGRAYGQYLKRASYGIDNDEIVEERKVQSIGRETTFMEDVEDHKIVMQQLYSLLKEVYEEVEQNGLNYSIVRVKVRYDDFSTFHKQRKVRSVVRDFETAYKVAAELVSMYLDDEKIRLIGVSLSGFS